jgi:hypothetical protein
MAQFFLLHSTNRQYMYLYILKHIIIYRIVGKVSNQKCYIILKQSIQQQKEEEYPLLYILPLI